MTTNADKVDVLVVGAGPVGLVSALILLRNGLSVRIIAKENEPRTGYRGPGIQPRTLELYKFLGVLDDIQAGSGSHQTIHQYTSPDNGEPPVILWDHSNEKTDVKVDKPILDPRIIGQVDHEAILRNRLSRDHGCNVEFGTELVSYEQQAKHVEAICVKIGTSETLRAQSDWLIGADGAHSVVRKQLRCTFLGESVKQGGGMLLADIHLLNGWGDDHIKAWGSISERSLMIRPYMSAFSGQHSTPSQPKNDTRVQVMIAGKDVDEITVKLGLSGAAGNTDSKEGRDTLVEMIYELSGRKDLVFGDLIGMGIWRPNIRMVDKFGEGRVWIAGDAAHVHSPTGGQGLNSGVQDAFNLCWKIALIQKGHNGSTANTLMESYTEERTRVVKAMLNITTRLLRQTFGVNGEDAAKADANLTQTDGDTISSSTGNNAPGKKQPSGMNFRRGFELRMFGINYRGSSIVLDEVEPPVEVMDPYNMSPDEPVRGGDRAPEAGGLKVLHEHSRGDITMSLFEIFDITRHTALVFARSQKADQELFRALSDYPDGTMRTVVLYPQENLESVPVYDKTELKGNVLEVSDSKGDAYGLYLRGIDFQQKDPESQGDGTVVVIVRPDGHVGAIVKDVEGVDRYRQQLFGS